MSKFGKDLIESMREAAEHAEGTRKSSDLGTALRQRRRTTTSPRGMMFRRREEPTHLPRPTEGRMVPAPPSRSHSQLRVHVVAVLNVRAIRHKLRMSQSEFAAKYRIPLPTLKNWEQGRRQPDAPAAAYLQAIAKRPNEISEALESDNNEIWLR